MYSRLTKEIPKNEHSRRYLADFPRMAEDYLAQPIRALSFADWMRFYREGSRVEYEAGYFDHRKRMDVFAMLVLSDPAYFGWDAVRKPVYLAALEDILAAICEEYTWVLPAHVPENASAETQVTTIDLFASETAFAFAELLYLLGDVLNPVLKRRMEYELHRRIIDAYLAHPTAWAKNNWAAVCANGVITAMAYLGCREAWEASKEWLIRALDNFLDSYAEDGCCKEGMLYWSYGFGNFVYAASTLRDFTDGAVDYFKDPKVKTIARFGFTAYLSENLTLPYSDGPHRINYNVGMFHFLKREYPELPLPDSAWETSFGEESRCRFADLSRNIFWYDETLTPSPEPVTAVDYPVSQWFIRSKPWFGFSCKGGNNDEPHNHNDLGSFFVLRNGQYLLDDLGWPEYDRDYFKPEARYSRYICSMSEGHSVPIIDGHGQYPGEDCRAALVSVSESEITLDLSAGYRLPGGSVMRTWKIDGTGVTVCDKITGCTSVTERFVTRIRPEASEHGFVIAAADAGAELTAETEAAEMRLSHETFTPRLVLHLGMNDTEIAYLMDFIYTAPGEYTFRLDIGSGLNDAGRKGAALGQI